MADEYAPDLKELLLKRAVSNLENIDEKLGAIKDIDEKLRGIEAILMDIRDTKRLE